MGRRNRDNDGKYFRLTGLWPSKKNDALWTGKVRNQDLGKFLDKVEEADKANADVVVFLWENRDKNGKKDPEFTVQISVSEDDGKGRDRGRSSGSLRRSSRDEEDNRDNDNDDNNNKDDNNEESEETEKPQSSSRRSSSKEESKGRSKSRSTGKRDKNDW